MRFRSDLSIVIGEYILSVLYFLENIGLRFVWNVSGLLGCWITLDGVFGKCIWFENLVLNLFFLFGNIFEVKIIGFFIIL